jgi:hypothetical protein
MGFFSSLWDGIKNVFKGILKVFAPILKPLGKFLNSGFGKVLMLVASVFTFGAALMAGGAAFSAASAAGSGFMQAFIEGGKAFVSTLIGAGAEAGAEGAATVSGEAALATAAETNALNPMALNAAEGAGAVAEGAAAGANALEAGKNIAEMGANAIDTAGNLATGATAAGSGGGGLLSQAGQAAGQVTSAPSVFNSAAANTALQTADTGNWLTNAAKKAWDFAKSDTGQEILGSAAEGYFEAKKQDDAQDHDRRIDDMWNNPNDPGMKALREQEYEASVPNASYEAMRIVNERNRNYQPSVKYRGAPAPAGG